MNNNGENKNKSLLRLTTAGSVDDGKSTLIGRLLYDSKSIFEDQLDHIMESGKRLGRDELDLSLLTDGLRAEREQGITIDVAYRYFATPRRKFIIADTPGHIQYTRNMVTGASTADLAVILTDARKGLLEQTLRHTYIASLLDIQHIVFCINKMDMVDWSRERFEEIRDGLASLAQRLETADVHFIPVSAKFGDNVVDRSANMPWYDGKTFLGLLETIEIKRDKQSSPARFPVQTVLRPHSSEYHDYRGYAGRVAGGSFRVGDGITVLPAMLSSRISGINVMEKNLDEAFSGDSVAVTIEDQIDIKRGDILVKTGEMPLTGQDVTLMTCWFNEKPLLPGGKYLLRSGTNEINCIVRDVNYKVNINNHEKEADDKKVAMNEIANVTVRLAHPLFYDPYRVNHVTGSAIFIDSGTNETTGAGMII